MIPFISANSAFLNFRIIGSDKVVENPIDYQQYLTNSNSPEQILYNNVETLQQLASPLPLPLNPRSTVDPRSTVGAYPPSQQPNYHRSDPYQTDDYRKFSDRYGERINFQQQPLLQVPSNDYNDDTAAYVPKNNVSLASQSNSKLHLYVRRKTISNLILVEN